MAELEETLKAAGELRVLIFSCGRREDGEAEFLLAEGILAREWGLDSGPVTGKTVRELLPARAAQSFMRRIQRAFDGSEIREEATIFGRRVQLRLFPMRENGIVTRVVGCALDLGEPRATRKREHDRSKNLEKILRHLPHVVFVCKRRPDGDVTITYYEGSLARAFGLPDTVGGGMTIRQLFSEKIVRRIVHWFDQVFAGQTVEFFVQSGGKTYRVMATPSAPGADGTSDELVGFGTDVTERMRAEESLHQIAQGVSSATGEAFFRSLVFRLTHVLGASHAFIGMLDPVRPDLVHTLVVSSHGAIIDNFVYTLDGTPCQQVIRHGLSAFPTNVQAAFPDDDMLKELGAESYIGAPLLNSAGKPLGILAVLHTRPVHDVGLVTSMLQIFAVRAAVELERKLAEEELVKTNAILKATHEASDDGLLIVNDKREIVSYNQRFADIWNLSGQLADLENEEQLLTRLQPLLRDPAQFTARVNELYAHPLMRSHDVVRLTDGRILEMYSKGILLADGQPYGRVWYFRDITEQQRYEEQIKQKSYHDPLTGLPNRVLFDDRLSQSLVQAKRSRNKLAVYCLDLDRFKKINETLGHDIGDRVLQQVAKRLGECLREGETLTRLGDEFIIMRPELHQVQEAAKLAQIILDAFSQPFLVDGYELFISPSIGMSIYPNDGTDGPTLLKHANTAMRRAKEKGRNTYQLYMPMMNQQAYESLALESDLRKAVERGELQVYYQPRVHLASGQLVGMEALVRWHHPELGLIPPARFIPLAEETGLIVQIDEYVLRTACTQNKAWQDAGLPPLRVAVNLSARQFMHKDVAATVAHLLSETGLDPRYLELEITESSAMHDAEAAVATLQRLKELGIHLAIDDFGTGYSSFNYLKQFPIDTLKIDRSFVRDIHTDPGDAEIVSAIIMLARSLKLNVVAEGVETEAQRLFLKRKKCEEMQGFLVSPPLPPRQFEERLRSAWGPMGIR